MKTSQHDECSVVALYGLNAAQEALEPLYQEVLQWFGDQGGPPDKLSVHGKGFTGKIGSFSRINSRLEKKGFQAVESLAVYSLLPDADLPPRDWSMTANVSLEHSIAVLAAECSLLDLDSLSNGISRKAVERLQPEYGIGYRRERRLGPDLYAWGISYGVNAYSGPEYEESVKISRWSDIGMAEGVYRQGLLRDVYPYNFLASTHLSRKVEGLPLQKWIQRDSVRGQLRNFQDGVSLWTLDDSAIPPVRRILQREGLIFDPNSAPGPTPGV